MNLDQNAIYCRELARSADKDRYITSLFAPAEARTALWAITAFNHEIAKTRESVSEPMLGEIRLQWWRDAINDIYAGSPRQHAVVLALSGSIQKFELERSLFETLIEGRTLDLQETSFQTVDALIAYVMKTAVPLHYATLRVVGVDDQATRACATAVGCAFGLTGLLRAAPYFFRQNRNFLPAELMEKFKLTDRAVFSLKPSQALADTVAVLAERAERFLDEAALALNANEIAPAARPALLAGAQAGWHLKHLRRASYNPHDTSLVPPIPFHELRLALKSFRGKWL